MKDKQKLPIWDLSDLYDSPDDPQLEKDQQKALQQAKKFAQNYKGEINSLSAKELKQAVSKYEDIVETMGKVVSFLFLKWSQDTNNEEYGVRLQKAKKLSSQIDEILIFFGVEWKNVSDDEAEKLLENDQLQEYKHYLRTSRLFADYTLTEEEEQILSAKSITSGSAWSRFFDEKMGRQKYEVEGKELSQEKTLQKLRENDRDLRKAAHQGLTKGLKENIQTLAYTFNTILEDKSIEDRLRGYENWIKSRNLSNEISDEAVESLIESVVDSYGLVKKFYKLKRRLLGVDDLYDYDRYAPVLESKKEISWKKAKEIVKEAYCEFHPKFGNVVEEFFQNNWIDAEMREGKRSGAFSAPTTSKQHPYVMVNFGYRLRDVQVLAHELGHGVHQYLSRKQGYLQMNTPLITAETASVFGEMLTFSNLMQKTDDEREKLSLLISKIDDNIATVFRQISLNRFEDKIHKHRRESGELKINEFCEYWRQTQQDLYGNSVELTDGYDYWWSYIPHFLQSPGYVYAYAFGQLLTLTLFKEYEQSEDDFEDEYIQMLQLGGSKSPREIVSIMDLDFTDSDFWDKGLGIIEDQINQAEELADKIDYE